MPLRHQILLVSQLDRNVTEIDDVKYLCVNSGKSVEKKTRSKGVILSQCLGQRPAQRNSRKSHD